MLSINKATRRVESLNMGDSGYIVYRKVGKELEEIFRSEDLVHDFNLPYQVGTRGDDPKKAHCDSHILYPGDIIVLATDGLWDNVQEEEIMKIVANKEKANSDDLLNEIAAELADVARRNALNTY